MKRVSFIILPLLIMLCLTGCVQYVELSERAIVQSIGVDYLPEQKTYRVSLQYFAQSDEGGQNQIDKTQANVLKAVGEGKSVCDAAENASIKTGKDLLLSENRLIILGKELAGYDLENALDFFVSNYHSHPEVNVAVADTLAEDIIDIRFKEGNVSSDKLVNMLTNAHRHGVCVNSSISDILTSLQSKTRSALLPLLTVKEEKTDVTDSSGSGGGGGGQGSQGGGQSGQGGSDEQKEKTVELSGGWAFVNGAGAGGFSPGDTAAVQLITNTAEELSLTVQAEDSLATVTLFRSNFTVTPYIEDGRLCFYIDGFAFGRFEERINVSESDEDTINTLTKKIEDTVCDTLSSAVAKLKDGYGCDAFGLENTLRHCMPDFWFDNEDNIPELLRSAKTVIKFSCRPYILGSENK